MAISYSDYAKNGGSKDESTWSEELKKRQKKRRRPYSQTVLKSRLNSSK